MAKYEVAIICPKCGWFGYNLEGKVGICPCKGCNQQLQEVARGGYDYFFLMPESEVAALKQSAIEEYCKTLDPKAVAKREKFDSELKKLEREGERKFAHQPKCPTCGSTNISKIGGLERGASVAMWGLFSKKINKSFKCNNPDCGYTW